MANDVPPRSGNMPQTQWKVTSQQETTQAYPGQGIQKGVTVTFTLADGTTGSVFVPDSQYNVTNVQAAIAARAGQLEAVGKLSNGM